MSQVKVITDSTADLPGEIAERLGIGVVPLNVHFGEETFLDGVEITSEEFLRRLASSRQMPKTSQPPPDSFRKSYEDAAAGGAEGVVCVTISSKLSGTYNSASLAARDFEGAPVRVVDSLSASLGLGFAAIAAAEAARGGAQLDEVERVARDTAGRTGLLFFADTLEYLQRNGRIGRAAGLLGSILEIKPVLTLEEGEAAQYQRARTRRKAIQALIDWAVKLRSPERVGVMWSDTEDDLHRLMDGLTPVIPRERIVVTKYGPVIGAHVGPGALGVFAVEGAGGA